MSLIRLRSSDEHLNSLPKSPIRKRRVSSPSLDLAAHDGNPACANSFAAEEKCFLSK